MKARGKREAQRNASPWLRGIKKESTESAKYQRQLFRSFRASRPLRAFTRGDAPHVVRRLPWLSYFAPSALSSDFLCKAGRVDAWTRDYSIRTVYLCAKTVSRCLSEILREI
jgi:hypothetical protein